MYNEIRKHCALFREEFYDRTGWLKMRKAALLFLALILFAGCMAEGDFQTENVGTCISTNFTEAITFQAEQATTVSESKPQEFKEDVPNEKTDIELALDFIEDCYYSDYFESYYDSTRAMMYDINDDGLPELVVGNSGFDNSDYGYSVFSFKDGNFNFIYGFCSDENIGIKKYYDAEKDEYFYVNRYAVYHAAGMFPQYADKVTFYDDKAVTHELAYRQIYFRDREYVVECKLNGEFVDAYGFIDPESDTTFDRTIDEYLSKYTLVDTLDTSDMISCNADKAEIETFFAKQIKEIEERHKSNPVTLQKQSEQIYFDEKYYSPYDTHIGINANKEIDTTALSKFKNIKSAYIYGYSESSEINFDIDILSEHTGITELTFCGVSIDGKKLAQFENLKSLRISDTKVNFSEIGKLKQLEHFQYDETTTDNTTDFSPLSELTNLKKLTILAEPKSYDFMKNMTELRVIFLDDRGEHSSEFYEPINSLPNLNVCAYSGHGGRMNFIPREDIMVCCIK